MGCSDKSSIQTPLAKAKGLGSAHHGTHHHMLHDITTIANIPLIGWVIYTIFSLRNATYEEFTVWMSHPVSIVVAVLFVLTTFKHVTGELQVVFEDYVPCRVMRTILVLGVKLVFLVLGVASIVALMKIAFTTGV
ncbi:MAG: succinate dehydrogenase, hydrophobic membrane anchor protein [Alphaproteobacteria bacterium]|nr:succinate dehydrogenase, hydrophobic membrane anchor protein [Alphaproteobacteria bacterium]